MKLSQGTAGVAGELVGPASFAIIAVCTGNICRSPAAERLLRDRFRLSPQVTTCSAGVGALVGDPIDPSMAQLLDEDQINSSQFAAQALTAQLVRDADLVLALSRRHRQHILELTPAAVKRTFTLKEFARLSARLREKVPVGRPDERLSSLVGLAGRHREGTPAELDDISDPYGLDQAAFSRAYGQIRSAVDLIAHAALEG